MSVFWRGRYLVLALILGAGLAASFLLPAFMEKGFVQSDRLIKGYFDFRGHFVAIPQFFSTFWGYGASLWGAKDDMSFQVGVAHWVLLALTAVAAVKFRKLKALFLLVVFLVAEFLFSLFMQHNRSAPIWEAFSLLAYTQFPWRFLGVSIFLASLLCGALVLYVPEKYRGLFLPVVLLAILVYMGYFRPESYYPDSIDAHYISPQILVIDDRLPKDYLPVWVKVIAKQKIATPSASLRTGPSALIGKAELVDFNRRSSSASFKANVVQDAQIEVPITYFPGWQVMANNQPVSIKEPGDLGLVKFDLIKGSYNISLQFTDTPVRRAANLVSVVSLLVVLALISRKIVSR